ncbi:MAG: hypothetical protein N3B21_19325 [Clostridia bacterium]|nr:hypothetical protein [Clostridia bacterium]
MAKVKMLKETNYNHIMRNVGSEHDDIPDDVALRWAGNGIAELIEEEEKAVDYTTMKPKALYDLCVSRGLTVEEKQPKEYYIEALTKADEAAKAQE